jgi:hypothetical protein
LKTALYELYLAAGPITLGRICDRVEELAAGPEVSDPTAARLSRETVRAILSDPTLPADLAKVTAVAAALVHAHPLPGKVAVVRGHPAIDRIRALWARAAAHRPPGRLITEVDSVNLEVHRAMPAKDGDADVLPTYILRAHDHALDDAVVAALNSGRSSVVMLISDSTSGKTRAMFEALHRPVQIGSSVTGQRVTTSLASAGWLVWPDITPISPQLFLDALDFVQPRTVIWLNEAQRYLIDPDHDTATVIAARLRVLLSDPLRAPILVMGTLWPEYQNQLVRRPDPNAPDHFAAARALLAGCAVPVPNTFTGTDLKAARACTDTRIRGALNTADMRSAGRRQATRVSLTQLLAGVPALLELHATASTPVSAVLNAAMDARRLGHSEWLPIAFLYQAAPAYLTEEEQRTYLTAPDWFTTALDVLTAPLSAASACALYRRPILPGQSSDNVVKLEDFLDQHGRRTRSGQVPPQGFWDAALEHAASPQDLHQLARSAQERLRLRIAHTLWLRAAQAGDIWAWTRLALLQDMAGHHDEADEAATRGADAGATRIWTRLAILRDAAGRQDEADKAAQRAADAGGPEVWTVLAERRESQGRHRAADGAARRAADCGDPRAWNDLAERREEKNQRGGAGAGWTDYYEANSRHGWAWTWLTELQDRPWRSSDAEREWLHIADTRAAQRLEARDDSQRYDTTSKSIRPALPAEDFSELVWRAESREAAGQLIEAEAAWGRVALASDAWAWVRLAIVREKMGRHNGATEAAQSAARVGDSRGWLRLALLRETAGRYEAADEAAAHAAEMGNVRAWTSLAEMRENTGRAAQAEAAWSHAAEAGDTSAWTQLAVLRERTGQRDAAEEAARRAVNAGHTWTWTLLTGAREEAGDHYAAEEAARNAANAGDAEAWVRLAETRDCRRQDGTLGEQLRETIDTAHNRRNIAQWILVFGLEADGSTSSQW